MKTIIATEQQYFYHPDHLGSSSFITDASGDAHQHLQYLPLGEDFISQRIDWQTRYTFSAKEKDKNTGYHYFGARYYDSDISVWLSVDPKSSGYPGISAYAYCYNNPMNYIDPYGLAADKEDRIESRYERKRERFKRTGRKRHGVKLTEYMQKNSEVLKRENARYNEDDNTVTFDVEEEIVPKEKYSVYGKSLTGVTVSYGLIKGKGEANILIDGAYNTSIENLGYHLRNFDRIIRGGRSEYESKSPPPVLKDAVELNPLFSLPNAAYTIAKGQDFYREEKEGAERFVGPIATFALSNSYVTKFLKLKKVDAMFINKAINEASKEF